MATLSADGTRPSGAAASGPAVRVTPSPASTLPGDAPVEIGAGDAWRLERADALAVRLVPEEAGAAGSTGSAGRPRRALLGTDRPAGRSRPRTIEVVVDGWRFELEVEDAARAALRERASRASAVSGPGSHLEVRAIIPGRVVSVDVAVGDAVEAGGHLLVVEAMKMQNEIRAQHGGEVERVAVTAGMTVERGDLLVVVRLDHGGAA